MGHFAAEINLTLYRSIRGSLQYTILISILDDKESLQAYSNEISRHVIEEQLVYFPNSTHVINSWIITTGELFDDIIIHDRIPITSMKPVQ